MQLCANKLVPRSIPHSDRPHTTIDRSASGGRVLVRLRTWSRCESIRSSRAWKGKPGDRQQQIRGEKRRHHFRQDDGASQRSGLRSSSGDPIALRIDRRWCEIVGSGSGQGERSALAEFEQGRRRAVPQELDLVAPADGVTNTSRRRHGLEALQLAGDLKVIFNNLSEGKRIRFSKQKSK